jgi:nicotinamide-nucleotide amidase
VSAPSAAAEAVAALRAAGATLSCAESLTAGLLAASVAAVPGASSVLRGGLVAYATDLKATLLGVPYEVLDRFGAVSEECAQAMATGAAARCVSTYALALTGVAGPDPQEGHPPGHVCLGLAGPAGVRSRSITLRGDRAAIRAGAVDAALAWLVADLGGEGNGPGRCLR